MQTAMIDLFPKGRNKCYLLVTVKILRLNYLQVTCDSPRYKMSCKANCHSYKMCLHLSETDIAKMVTNIPCHIALTHSDDNEPKDTQETFLLSLPKGASEWR
jgi:hypothetical protein